MDALCQRIESLFDERRPQIKLATVHRTKGLEADRVFILRPDALPLVRPEQQPWQLEQEMNLKYVAYTRAKESLFIVADCAEDTPLETKAAAEVAAEAPETKTDPAAATGEADSPTALVQRIADLEARIAALEATIKTLTENASC